MLKLIPHKTTIQYSLNKLETSSLSTQKSASRIKVGRIERKSKMETDREFDIQTEEIVNLVLIVQQ